MTVIKINAITVASDSGDELARRFAARAGAVDGQPGFEGFELLKPVDERTQWLVVTRWSDEESYQAWRTSESFGRGHGGTHPQAPAAEGGDRAPGDPHGHPGSRPAPIAMASELWSYEVAVTSPRS